MFNSCTAADEFVESAKQYTLPEDKPVDEGLLQIIDQLKGYRDLCIDYCEALIYSALPVSETIASLIERLFNELHNATENGSYNKYNFEVWDFMIWELFISITATLLHYEKYEHLHKMLVHTYFLRENYYTSTLKPCNYTKFRTYCRTIEETCKKKCYNPNIRAAKHQSVGSALLNTLSSQRNNEWLLLILYACTRKVTIGLVLFSAAFYVLNSFHL